MLRGVIRSFLWSVSYYVSNSFLIKLYSSDIGTMKGELKMNIQHCTDKKRKQLLKYTVSFQNALYNIETLYRHSIVRPLKSLFFFPYIKVYIILYMLSASITPHFFVCKLNDWYRGTQVLPLLCCEKRPAFLKGGHPVIERRYLPQKHNTKKAMK